MTAVGVSGYSVVHARVRALYSGMLAPETWQRLREAQDFAAVISRLKETVYESYLAPVEEADLTPRRAVYQIKKHLADAFATIIRVCPDRAQPLLTQLLRQFEVDNLKATLRGLVASASWDEVRYLLFPLGSATVLPAEAMVEAGSIGAAVDLLHGTPYYPTLSHAMERYTAEQSLFSLEVALDLDYWRELWRDINRLSGQDREWALRLVGSVIDMNNLMWALRYRVYHHLAEEEIINYTLPFGYRVHDRDVRAIAAGADMATVVSHVYPDLADVSSLLEEPEKGLPGLEVRLQRRIGQECHAAFVGYPFHVGIPLGYLLLSEQEIEDLTVLIEAKALRIPAERFQRFLIVGCVPQ
jgi:V/A-type H+-transporting ATPase subunit C